VSEEESREKDEAKPSLLVSILRRWGWVLIVGVFVVGTVLVAVAPDPDHLHSAHYFQVARRDDDWDQVGELMHPEFERRGGHAVDLIGYLAAASAHPQYRFPAPVARTVVGRVSEGIGVADTDWRHQILCLRPDEDDEWRVVPTPFLLYEMEHDEPLDLPDGAFSPESAMAVLPEIPPTGWNQARVLVDPIWVRETPEGTLRVLLQINVAGEHIALRLESVLINTYWSPGGEGGQQNYADRILWTEIFPDADGVWPLEPGAWLMDLEWADVPESEFELHLGEFMYDPDSASLTISGLKVPR